MARRGPRGLTPEEAELWDRIAASARAIGPRKVRPPAKPAPVKVDPDRPAPVPVEPPKALPSFRIGQAAADRQSAHALVPSLSERLKAEPLRMDRKAFLRMQRGKLVPEAKLDLHGMTLAEAHPALIRFILASHGMGARLVLVVTGKGRDRDEGGPIPTARGILRHQVPQWLRMPPLGTAVLQVAEAHRSHGGAGALYVYLRRHG